MCSRTLSSLPNGVMPKTISYAFSRARGARVPRSGKRSIRAPRLALPVPAPGQLHRACAKNSLLRCRAACAITHWPAKLHIRPMCVVVCRAASLSAKLSGWRVRTESRLARSRGILCCSWLSSLVVSQSHSLVPRSSGPLSLVVSLRPPFAAPPPYWRWRGAEGTVLCYLPLRARAPDSARPPPMTGDPPSSPTINGGSAALASSPPTSAVAADNPAAAGRGDLVVGAPSRC